jgi:anti-sigma B factor antagonist
MANDSTAFRVRIVERRSSAPSGEPAVVVVTGEVDVETSKRLADAIQGTLDAGTTDIVVDLAAVRFIDASGIGALVRGSNDARRSGGRLALRTPSAAVRRLLTVPEFETDLYVEQ